MAERGVIVTHETIRQWCLKFGQTYAHALKKRRGKLGDKWHAGRASFSRINGKIHYLWRAVDQDGNVLDIRVAKPSQQACSQKVLRAALRVGLQYVPRVIITDKLASYAAAKREIMPSVEHRQHKGLNNCAERSHQRTRQRERTMRRFRIPRPCTTLPLGLWSDLRSFSAQTTSSQCLGLSCPHAGSLPGLE